jgi:hypothetical protein
VDSFSRPTSGSPLREAIYEVSRPQPSEGRRASAEDPLRGNCQMRGRSEVEYPGDVSYVVPGILGQLCGRHETNEIDYPLEIWCSGPRKIPAQMLTTEADGLCELFSGYRATGVCYDDFPRVSLQLRRETQNVRRLAQCLPKPRGKSVGQYEIARGIVIDSIDDDIDEPEGSAPRNRRSVRRPQRENPEEWSARKLGGERRRLPGVVVGRAEVDERSIDENATKNRFQLFGRSGGDDLPPASGERRANERASAFALEMNEKRRQHRAVGDCCHA